MNQLNPLAFPLNTRVYPCATAIRFRFMIVLFMTAMSMILATPFLDSVNGLLRSACAEEATDPMANPIVSQVIEFLREQTGQEPDTEAIVEELDHITTSLYQVGRHIEAVQVARTQLELAERELGREHSDTLASLNNLAELYRGQGHYGEAEPLYERALATSESALGKEHPDTLISINNLALLYQAQGRYAEAESLNRHALATRERVLGKGHPNTLSSLNNLAGLYYTQGRYSEAEPLFKRALAARERVLGEDHPDTLGTLNNLVGVYWKQGRYGEAEPFLKRALAANERILGNEHSQTFATLNNLAFLYQTQGRYGEAEPLFKRLLESTEQVFGSKHPDTLTSVNNLASLYEAQGRYEEAEPLYQHALNTSEQVLGSEHPDTIASLNNLAGLYFTQGHYGKAEPLYERALAVNKRVLGNEHPHTLSTLNNLAVLYKAQGHYGKAESLYQQVLASREEALGTEHPDTLQSLNNLAGLYESLGSYEKAEGLLQRALATSERMLGAEHPYTLQSLNSLAVLYGSQGRYGEAEPLLKRVLETEERMLGAEHPDTLQSLNNLGMLYKSQVRYGEAETFLERALVSRERVLGIEHPNTIKSLNNLAELYRVQRRYEEAELLYNHALVANEQKLGLEHPRTLVSLNNLALLYQTQGRYEEAEPIFKRLMEFSERVLGAEHPQTLASLNNLALLYKTQGHYEKAEPRYQRLLAFGKRVLGAEHPNILSAQLSLIGIHINNRKIPQALAELREMDGRLQGFVGAQLRSTLSEQVRRQWLVSKSNFQSVVFTLALAEFVPVDLRTEAQALAANVFLRWKRLAGEGEGLMARIARVSTDPKVRELAGQLTRERSQLSRLVNLPQHDKDAIGAARTRVEKLEVALAGVSGAYRSHRAGRTVDWQQVRAALPTGSALLSLRAFEQANFNTGKLGERHWLGMVIPKDPGEGPAIILKDLGPVAAIAPMFEELREGTRSTASGRGVRRLRAESKREAQKLYAQLFEELDEELAKYDRLYIAPDGMLDLVAFSRLVLPDGRYWADRQQLHQLRAGRDLVRAVSTDCSPSLALGSGNPCRNGGEGLPTDLVAFGGVNYDKFPTDASPLLTNRHAASTISASGSTKILAMNRRLRDEREEFEILTKTAPEAMATVQDYRDLSGYTAKAWYGTDASEGRLKNLSTPPRVLHLATHGFFLGKNADRTERPMALGGLTLAGANRGMAGEVGPDGEDGILYAMEARDLNLEGTKLVVLSACDTGHGEVDYSEGVYGLTRAFRIAGAKNILMTLWSLDDALAAEFMKDFYARWLGNSGQSPADALHQTRLAWIASEDERKRNPQYWAPYVLVE